MVLKLTDKTKSEVLVKMLEETEKQIIWLKNLDYKVMYYTFLFILVLSAWVATSPSTIPPKLLLVLALLIMPIISIVFLIKNHLRHSKLRDQYGRIAKALKLNTEEYGEIIYPDLEKHDLIFHLGRMLYIFLLIAGTSLAGYFVWNLNLTPRSALAIEESLSYVKKIYPKQENKWIVNSLRWDDAKKGYHLVIQGQDTGVLFTLFYDGKNKNVTEHLKNP